MAYKLVIADIVGVPVKFTMNDAGKSKNFQFTVDCKRLTQDVIRDRTKDGEVLIKDFLPEVMEGWRDQKLVIDDDGKPAEFNDESRDFMLNVAGLPLVIYTAYLKECGAQVKN
jgi:hypothetical protein